MHVCVCASVTPFSSIEVRCWVADQLLAAAYLARWVTADTCLSHAEQLTWKLMFHISNHLSLLHCREAVGVRRGDACVCVCLCMLLACVFVTVSIVFSVSLCPFEDVHACSS